MPDQATRMREIARQYMERNARRRQHIIAFTSGKGGVGKSTLALNTALALSGSGHSVLLVDADTNLGSIDVMLGVAPRYRIGDVLRGNMDVEDVLVSGPLGLKLLPASTGDVDYPLGGEQMRERLMAEILATDEEFDCILLDTGAGLNDEVIGYAGHADELIVVTTPEPTAIMDAYAMIKVVWSVAVDTKLQVVINNARTPRDAEEVGAKLRMAVNHFLKRDIDITAAIPSDPNVSKAITQQVPLLQAYPHSAASLSIQSFAHQLELQIMAQSERKAI